MFDEKIMKRLPKILLTNDDGIHSPGLRAAAHAVMHLGELLIIAPATQQTGMGRSFAGKFDVPLASVEYSIDGQSIQAYQCEGSPALAVQHGFNIFFPQEPPELLISGINYGENLGSNVTVSGTIGAALEGASGGTPAIAASLQTEEGHYFHYSDQEWDVAGHFLALFAERLLAQKMPFDVDVLKIDVPDTATTETPWRITRVSRSRYYSTFLENPTPETPPSDTRLSITVDRDVVEADSDIQALALDQVVSVTPLSLDLTSRTDFQELETLLRIS